MHAPPAIPLVHIVRSRCTHLSTVPLHTHIWRSLMSSVCSNLDSHQFAYRPNPPSTPPSPSWTRGTPPIVFGNAVSRINWNSYVYGVCTVILGSGDLMKNTFLFVFVYICLWRIVKLPPGGVLVMVPYLKIYTTKTVQVSYFYEKSEQFT